jgi:hypothetical protein
MSPNMDGLKAVTAVAIAVAFLFMAVSPMFAIESDDSSAAVTSSGIQYAVNGNRVTITGYSGTSGDLVIPASINGKTVTAISASAFSGNTTIQTVTFASGSQITTLPSNVFQNCTSLTSVALPSGLTSIGNSVFAGSGVTSIAIPSGVTSIGNYAFNGCTALTGITFAAGSTLATIGTYAFANCTSLTSFEVPATVTTVGNYAFYGDAALTSVTFDGTALTSLGHDAFNGCGMTSIMLPSGLTSVQYYTFRNCASLKYIYIPSSVTNFSAYALAGCSNVIKVIYDGSYGYAVSVNGNVGGRVYVSSYNAYAVADDGYTFEKWTYGSTTSYNTSVAVSAGNSYVAYFAPKTYTVTWVVDGDSTVQSYLCGAVVTAPAVVMDGFAVVWSPTVPSVMPAQNLTVTASFIPAVAGTYTVEHYRFDALGNASMVSSQTLAGYVGATTAAVADSYDGYTVDVFNQKTVAADGSTVVRIYYQPMFYVLTVAAGSHASVTVTGEGGRALGSGSIIYYGEELTAYDSSDSGYTVSAFSCNGAPLSSGTAFTVTGDMAVSVSAVYTGYSYVLVPKNAVINAQYGYSSALYNAQVKNTGSGYVYADYVSSSSLFTISNNGGSYIYPGASSSITVTAQTGLAVGTYVTYIYLKHDNGTNDNWTYFCGTVTLIVSEARREAPNVTVTNGTAPGVISGADTTMEYSYNGGEYTSVASDGDMTGLAAGSYSFRRPADAANTLPSNETILVIKPASATGIYVPDTGAVVTEGYAQFQVPLTIVNISYWWVTISQDNGSVVLSDNWYSVEYGDTQIGLGKGESSNDVSVVVPAGLTAGTYGIGVMVTATNGATCTATVSIVVKSAAVFTASITELVGGSFLAVQGTTLTFHAVGSEVLTYVGIDSPICGGIDAAVSADGMTETFTYTPGTSESGYFFVTLDLGGQGGSVSLSFYIHVIPAMGFLTEPEV